MNMNIVFDNFNIITDYINSSIKSITNNDDNDNDYYIYIYIAYILIILYFALYVTKKAFKIFMYILLFYFIAIFIIKFFENLYYRLLYNMPYPDNNDIF